MLGAACKDVEDVQRGARPQAGAGDVNGGRINGTDSRGEGWCAGSGGGVSSALGRVSV
jgi:hypothetical protein